MLGDFNIPKIKWTKNEDFPEESFAQNFLDFVNDNGLVQLIPVPTLGKNFLDLLLCQHKNCILEIQTFKPFSTSDHDTIEFQIFSSSPLLDLQPKRDFKKGNYVEINAILQTFCWPEFFSDCARVQQFYDKFLKLLLYIIECSVPFQKQRKSLKYPKSILKLQSKKRSLWKKLKRDSDSNLKFQYKQICCEVNIAISKYFVEKESKLLQKGSYLRILQLCKSKLKHSSFYSRFRSR